VGPAKATCRAFYRRSLRRRIAQPAPASIPPHITTIITIIATRIRVEPSIMLVLCPEAGKPERLQATESRMAMGAVRGRLPFLPPGGFGLVFTERLAAGQLLAAEGGRPGNANPV
jgi:hypothetical protein